MTGLFEAMDGALPISDIAGIQNRPAAVNRAERYIVHKFSGRGTTELFTWEYAELMARPVSLAPAAPGTFLLRSYIDDADSFLDALPILAWAICMDGQTRPVLPGGVNRRRVDDFEPDFVKLPDGGIYQFGHEAEPDRFADEEAVLAHLRKEHQLRRERAERNARIAPTISEPVA